MTCEISCDYNLKQSGAALTLDFGLEFLETLIIPSKLDMVTQSTIVCEAKLIKKLNNKIQIDWGCLGINWKPDNDYRLVFGSDSFRDVVADLTTEGNPEFEVEFTSNPLPALRITDPTFQSDPLPNSTDVINNTKIEFIFDRVMRTDCSGKLYLYENAATDILLRTYTMGVDIESKVYSSDLTKFTIDTLGLLKANTNYYVISDGRVFRDWDNMAYPAFAPGDYTFTTDQSTDLFPDLISFVLASGTLVATFVRTRNPGAMTLDASATLTGPATWRLRSSPSSLTAETNQTAGLTYANGNLKSQISSEFEFVDIFVNYTSGGQSNLAAAAALASIIGVIKEFLSSYSVDSTISASTFFSRTRDTPFTNSASFDQTSNVNYGMLDTTRSADTYSTNTTTTISGGPLLTDTRGPVNSGAIYSIDISSSDLSSMGSLSTNTSNLKIFDPINVVSNNGGCSAINNKFYVLASQDTIKVFSVTTGALITTITAPIVTTSFGSDSQGVIGAQRMDLSDDYLLIGDNDATAAGKAYLYSTTTWNLIRTFDNPNPTDPVGSPDYFGLTVALCGSFAIVSAIAEDTAGGMSYGKVYIFNISNGSLVTTISGNQVFDFRGQFLSANTNHVAISDSGNPSQVKITDPSNGSVINTITMTASTITGISLTDNYLLIGTSEGTAGKVYVYNTSTYALIREHTLTGPTVEGGYNYVTVSISDNYYVVGQPYYGSTSSDDYYGRILIFNTSNGTLLHTVNRPNGVLQTKFGRYVNIFNDIIIINSDPQNATTNSFIFTQNTSSFNAVSKTLTISGIRLAINTIIDQITYIPATGYTGNFTLTYTATRTSDSFVSNRTQAVTRV